MINLAKQNQYVEFAEKDSKGRNIADKIDELNSKPAGTKLYRHDITLREHVPMLTMTYNPSTQAVSASVAQTYAEKKLTLISPSPLSFVNMFEGSLARSVIAGSAFFGPSSEYVITAVAVDGTIWLNRSNGVNLNSPINIMLMARIAGTNIESDIVTQL